MSTAKPTPYLSNDQVHALNEKHGWFQFRDAQSDVSRAFAQDAIEMHERMRAAAPELLRELRASRTFIQAALDEEAERTDHMSVSTLDLARRIDLAILKATGSAT
jgi:hypothetical protein